MKKINFYEVRVGDLLKIIGTVKPWLGRYWVGKVEVINSARNPQMKVFDTNGKDKNIAVIRSDIIYKLNEDELMVECL